MSSESNRTLDTDDSTLRLVLKGLVPLVTQTIVFSATNVITTLLFLSLLTFLFFINIGKILDLVLKLLFQQSEEDSYKENPSQVPLLPSDDEDFFQTTVSRQNAQQQKQQVDYQNIMQYFNSYEINVMGLLIRPDQLNMSFKDIAGYDKLIKQIKQQVILPMRYAVKHKKIDALTSPPRGILLYGPPGCGKTMLAKAMSAEISAAYINFDISTIKNKWVGETEKMATSLFSVAKKLQPTIIFIDEIDAFLSQRNENDQATEATLKAIFLQQWDGLLTDPNAQIIILGASNRFSAIDPAILRRLSLQFEVPLPDQEQRLEILKSVLKDQPLDDDVELRIIAEQATGYAGSDLKELCRAAANSRLAEYYQECNSSSKSSAEDQQEQKSTQQVNTSKAEGLPLKQPIPLFNIQSTHSSNPFLDDTTTSHFSQNNLPTSTAETMGLRPICMSDLLRALEESRLLKNNDYPKDMYL